MRTMVLLKCYPANQPEDLQEHFIGIQKALVWILTRFSILLYLSSKSGNRISIMQQLASAKQQWCIWRRKTWLGTIRTFTTNVCMIAMHLSVWDELWFSDKSIRVGQLMFVSVPLQSNVPRCACMVCGQKWKKKKKILNTWTPKQFAVVSHHDRVLVHVYRWLHVQIVLRV